jgi:hypothetical protein
MVKTVFSAAPFTSPLSIGNYKAKWLSARGNQRPYRHRLAQKRRQQDISSLHDFCLFVLAWPGSTPAPMR